MKVLHAFTCAVLFGMAVSPALAVDNMASSGTPDLAGVRTKIKAKDYQGAITELNTMIDKGVQHADAYNLLGFSLRKSGDTKTAMTYYKKALDFDPNHKGALEYSGELYVQIGDIAKARAVYNPAAADLCLFSCPIPTLSDPCRIRPGPSFSARS